MVEFHGSRGPSRALSEEHRSYSSGVDCVPRDELVLFLGASLNPETLEVNFLHPLVQARSNRGSDQSLGKMTRLHRSQRGQRSLVSPTGSSQQDSA